MEPKYKFYLSCDCLCSFLQFVEDDGLVYMAYYRSSFYSEQFSFMESVKEYFKNVWFAVTNKNFRLYDVVLTDEQVKKLAEFLNEIPHKESNE